MWTKGDKVDILLVDPDGKSSSLSATAEDALGTSALKLTSGNVTWGTDESQTYHFYSVYPANTSFARLSTTQPHIATFAVPRNQDVVAVADASGNFVCRPDMRCSYMAGRLDTKPTNEVVIPYHNVMTTLDVEVQGRPGTTTTLTNLLISGLRTTGETFAYNMDTQEIVPDANLVTPTTALSEARDRQNTINVQLYSVVNGDTVSYVELPDSKTLKVRVFIPPFAIGPAVDEAQLKVTLLTTFPTYKKATVKGFATEKNGQISIAAIPPRKLAQIRLSPLPQQQPNDELVWQKDLPDNAYVRDLSLPGTHSSMANTTDGVIGTSGIKTAAQSYSVKEQLARGIRGFDLRFNSKNGLVASHYDAYDYSKTGVNALRAWYDIASWLNGHPTEFVVLLVGGDDMGDTNINWGKYLADVLTGKTGAGSTVEENLKLLKGNLNITNPLEFSSNLTVKNVRGRMILMFTPCPNNVSNTTDYEWWADYYGGKNETKSQTGVHIAGWPDHAPRMFRSPYRMNENRTAYFFKDYKDLSGPVDPQNVTPNDGTLRVQFFEMDSQLGSQQEADIRNRKLNLVQSLFADAAGSTYSAAWFINNLAVAYTSLGSTWDSFSAKTQGQMFLNLSSNSAWRKYRGTRWGLMLLDFAGTRTPSTGNNAYGDVFVPLIISNNYVRLLPRH